MFWNYVIAFVAFLVTVIWASFGITVPMIILRFANPLIGYLEARRLINAKAARKRNGLTLFIWVVIDAVFVGIALLIGNLYVWIGAGIGLAWNLIFGLGRTGKTGDNMQDFIQSYGNYFTTEDREVLTEALTTFMRF